MPGCKAACTLPHYKYKLLGEFIQSIDITHLREHSDLRRYKESSTTMKISFKWTDEYAETGFGKLKFKILDFLFS
jgi:hypothetical protein